MNEEVAKEIVNKIFNNVFHCNLNYGLDEVLEKFAFDVKLPKQVNDSVTNEVTWADSVNSGRFVTLSNMEKRDKQDGWMLPRRDFDTLEDLIKIWNTVSLTTTERVYDSIDVAKSDTIYRCEKVYRSTNCSDAKNIVFCDSCDQSEYLLASQRSTTTTYSIRVDDSQKCSNSYNVICSNKISNSLFIQDCFDLDECIFCSHIASKKYCIANMQFEKDEYFAIKEKIVEWIINS